MASSRVQQVAAARTVDEAAGPSASIRPVALVGADTPVPIAPSGEVPYCNLDFAASAPPLRHVQDVIDEFLPWYSSIHRGAGFKSQVASAAYDGARESVRRFLNARPDDLVIFTRNTTDSVNLLERALPPSLEVVTFAFEHHANLLPWRRRRRVIHLPVPGGPAEMIASLRESLASHASPVLVAISGAPNVTGEVVPLAELARVIHDHGSTLFVDAAQLAPHRAIDMTASGIDFLALSGHKLYAPYGTGALVGAEARLGDAEPYLAGGGAVELVTLDDVIWSSGPERHEAGTPNLIGAVALAAACDHLAEIGMDRIAAAEEELYAFATRELLAVPGLELYSTWDLSTPHIGVLTFNLAGYDHAAVGTVLSVEHGIGVRDGCFCAHPLMAHLLRITEDDLAGLSRQLRSAGRAKLPGAVRASLGLDSTRSDVLRLTAALRELAADGPRWTYRVDPDSGSWSADPDPRRWPALGVRLQRGG